MIGRAGHKDVARPALAAAVPAAGQYQVSAPFHSAGYRPDQYRDLSHHGRHQHDRDAGQWCGRLRLDTPQHKEHGCEHRQIEPLRHLCLIMHPGLLTPTLDAFKRTLGNIHHKNPSYNQLVEQGDKRVALL